MFERLREWLRGRETSVTETTPIAPQDEVVLSYKPAVNPVNTLEDVAKVFANSLLRPPRGQNDRAVASNLERDVYNNILKLLKDGVTPDSLPKCPTTITQLLQVLQQEDSSYKDVTALINKEPVLASKVITLANNPLFRPKSGEVTSIENAAQLLGMAKLSALATTIMMRQLIEIKPIYFKMFGKYLWEHSQQCALACGYLAERSGHDYFNAYLIGLVHDIGKLVIFQELLNALRQSHPDVHPNEKLIASIVDHTAAQLSCVSLKHWNLPMTIQTAVCEQAKKQDPEEFSPMGYILYSANILSEIWLLLQQHMITREQAEQLLQRYDLPLSALEEIFAAPGEG